MITTTSRIVFAVCLLAWGLVNSIQAGTERRNEQVERVLPELNRLAREYADAFATPGVAIAVVTPDRRDYITFGVREAGRKGAINESTIFQLASVSKPITSTFAAILVSQGKLKWSDSIVSLLPSFTFADRRVTQRTTVRDMLSQRSGLPGEAGDFLETLGYRQPYILQQMRYVNTEKDFRKQWAYANFGITIGGNAAAATTGETYARAVRDVLFRPAGMKDAFVGYSRLERIHNRAHLHFTIDGVSKPLFIRDAESEAPGGGVNGSIRDMAALLQLHLNQGQVGGSSLASPEALQQTYQPLSKIRENFYYGLCWNVSTLPEGGRNINHSGAFLAGSRTLVSFWPEEGVGIAVLTNNFPSLLPEVIAEAFHQLYTKGKVERGLLQRYQQFTRQAFDTTQDVERTRLARPLADLVNGRPLIAFAGTYENDYVGEVEIREERSPEAGRSVLRLYAGPLMKPVEIRQMPASGELVSTTAEGDGITYQFSDLQGGAFQTLRIPELTKVGWADLKRKR